MTDEKWNKARDIITKLKEELEQDPHRSFNFKRLERDRGFLCHMAMTYDQILPFLKGLHLTLCSHMRQRDELGSNIQELE